MLFRQRFALLRRLCRVGILLIAVTGCGRAVRTFNIPQENSGGRSLAAIHQIANRLPSTDYKLGPGDVIEIAVHGVDGLEATVRVPQTGTFDFPLIGGVRAAGRSVPQLENAMAQAMRERYINNPHILIFVREFNSYRISVVGAVTTPGTIIMKKGGCTLVDALAEAGGLTDKAGGELFVTTYDASGEARVRQVDLQRLLEDGDLNENPPLTPGSSVYVPECGYVFVTGYVEEPGAYPLRKNMTALQAISTAGDFTSTASRRVRLVRRISPTKVEVRKINLAAVSRGKAADVELRKSDVIRAEASIWKVPVYGTYDFIKGVLGVGTAIP